MLIRALALLLFVLLTPLPASAVVAIVQNPTLLTCAATSCTVTFGVLPTVGNTIVVLYRLRFTHTALGVSPIFSTFFGYTAFSLAANSSGQGGDFTTTYPGAQPLAARLLQQFNSDTSSNAGVVGCAYVQSVGATAGTYTVTISHADIHHVSIKGYELSGLDTGVAAGSFFVGWPTPPPAPGVTTASTKALTSSATTTGNAAVFHVVGPVDPTGLTHSNTGGGWTECAGCPDTNASTGAPVDIVYKLNTTAGTYTDDWTTTNLTRYSSLPCGFKAP